MSHRIEKVNKLIKQQLLLLIHDDFPEEIVSINFINTTRDLSETTVYVTVLSEHKSVYEELCNNKGKYWKALSKKLYIKRLPKINILRDEMKDDVSRVEEILERK